MAEFSHLDEKGGARMVDVSRKEQTVREAKAQAVVRLNEEAFSLLVSGGLKKGDAFAVARIAGIMAAKKTPELIPLCHPIFLSSVEMDFEQDIETHSIKIIATARAKGETGVEMEALTAVSAAALSLYDMCKAVQKDIEIHSLYLLSKTGGKSGDYFKGKME